MTKGYEINKRWRKKYPHKRQASTARYYAKTQNAKFGYTPWLSKDDEMVLKHEVCDMELHRILGRSVAAIQHRRHILKKRIEEKEVEKIMNSLS